MQRFFGRKKPEVKGPSLDEASSKLDERVGSMDQKVKKIDAEIRPLQEQRKKMKPGPAKARIEKRLLQLMKQRKLYDKQVDTLRNSQFNIEQTKFAQDNIKDAVTMVGAMKEAAGTLKTSMKEVNLDEIEDLHDDMNDLLQDTEEIQEIMGRSTKNLKDCDTIL